MTKLFVGGLPFSTDNNGLRDLFTQFGEVLSAQVVMDRFSGRSKGFGFVEMANDDEAQKAIDALNGSDMGGRKIGVSVARPKEDRPRNDYNRGDRGGYNRDDRNDYHREQSQPQEDTQSFNQATEAPVEETAAEEAPTEEANQAQEEEAA